MNRPLNNDDYKKAAHELGCEVNMIKALAYLEGRGKGFLNSGDPIILFEPFKFGTITGAAYINKTVMIDGKEHPLSLTGEYSREKAMYIGGEKEYIKFRAAAQLNRDAAIMATSWGKFQILGQNYAVVGYETPQRFLEAMYKDEQEHLKAFVKFCSYPKMKAALQYKAFEEIARRYNGAGYKKSGYHIKLKKAYEDYQTGRMK